MVRSSLQAALLNRVLKLNRRFWRRLDDVPIDLVRARAEKLSSYVAAAPTHVRSSWFSISGVPVQFLVAATTHADKQLLYLHGGGYIAGSPDTSHRDFIWRIGEAAGCPVLALNYAKAPEQPFPKALDQVVDVYRKLIERKAASSIALAGDSAGGGLALAALLKIRDERLPLPVAVVLLSPWIDLTCSGGSIVRNATTEVMVPEHLLPQIASMYCGSKDPSDPYISPLFGTFDGLPPTLIQVSRSEVLLDDATRLANRMKGDGVDVRLNVWRNMPHVWPVFARYLPEGRAAIRDIGLFLKRYS